MNTIAEFTLSASEVLPGLTARTGSAGLDATLLPWLLFAWLTLEAIWDLRNQNVPVWFSLVMLLPGIILLAFDSFLVAIMVVISLASTEVVQRIRPLGIAGLYLPLVVIPIITPTTNATLGSLPLVIGWALFVTLWLLGIVGGADALAGLSLLLFFPSWTMFACIVAGILIWSVALLILRYGRSAGLRLWTVASTRAAGTQAAGIGAYALAALIFGVLEWFTAIIS